MRQVALQPGRWLVEVTEDGHAAFRVATDDLVNQRFDELRATADEVKAAFLAQLEDDD